eukprot:945024-Rhodomonas_salina.1
MGEKFERLGKRIMLEEEEEEEEEEDALSAVRAACQSSAPTLAQATAGLIQRLRKVEGERGREREGAREEEGEGSHTSSGCDGHVTNTAQLSAATTPARKERSVSFSEREARGGRERVPLGY